MRGFALSVALGICSALPLSAQRLERPVIPGGAGPNRLTLDATLLAGAQPFHVADVSSAEGRAAVATNGASDLRLYDAANREVPYLLVTPQVEAQWRAARVLRVEPTKTSSGFEADLEQLLPIDRIRLEGLPAPFLKRMRLEGSGDRSHWTILVADGTLFDLPNEQLELTTLDFTAGSYRYLRVTWDDRSSARIPLPRRINARIASATHGPAPLRTQVTIERRPSEPGKSRFRIQLPGAHLPIIAIELNIAGGNVLRPARITEGRLDGGAVVPTELGTATLRRSVRDGLAAASLRIPISPPNEAQLELAVDDGNNPPLEVTGATAIFATLPFIFFESNGQPLVARYGDVRLKVPSYDLEAERERVPSLTLMSARWGEPHSSSVAVSDSAAAMPLGGAEIDQRTFRYSRAIPNEVAGLTTLPLDAAALAHGSLADIRIAAAGGRQVPFLVERLDEPLSVALPALERVKSARDPASRSHYLIHLPYAGLPGSRLVLGTDARVFDREVAVEMLPSAEDDTRARGRSITIAQSPWQHTQPELPAPALTIGLPPLRVADLSLVIDEGDNAPLPIRDATLLLPAYRLRFFRDGHTPLMLLYGRPDLAAPRYDLTLVAPRLLGATAQDVVPGPEQGSPNVTGVTPTVVFWGALALAVLVLVVLIARLLRPDGGTPTAPATATTTTSTSSATPAPGE
ncbi:MAG TPA: DUF3999 family protein [Gemmatimonadaceae bacterium]|nr:DUF3999 family protein [Gemmatimonadaceae bacterium]